MKHIASAIAIAFMAFSCLGGDMVLTNKAFTFTTRDGKRYEAVNLVRATKTGVVWLKDASGGLVVYTNLTTNTIYALKLPKELVADAENAVVAEELKRKHFLATLHKQGLVAQQDALQRYDAHMAKLAEARQLAEIDAAMRREEAERQRYENTWQLKRTTTFSDGDVYQTYSTPNGASAKVINGKVHSISK